MSRFEAEKLAYERLEEFLRKCEQARILFLEANMPLPPPLERLFGKQEPPPDWCI